MSATTPTPSRAPSPSPSPSAEPVPRSVAFIGDSWTEGAGATGEIGYAHLTGRALGWEHRVLGVGGSGYVVGGRGDSPFGERVAAAVEGDPDVVVIQGSINERGVPTDRLSAAMSDTLGRLAAAAGADTEVLVLGASHVPARTRAEVDRINDLLRTAAREHGLRFVDVAAENWTDAGDPSIWADPVHPNDRGHRLVAERLAPLIEELGTA